MSDKQESCKDFDGTDVFVGDKVWYYETRKCQGNAEVGTIWAIGDMNEVQTNMPFLKSEKGVNIGAYSRDGIRKYNNTL